MPFAVTVADGQPRLRLKTVYPMSCSPSAAQTMSAAHLERICGTTGAAQGVSGVSSRSSRGVKRWSDVGEKNGV